MIFKNLQALETTATEFQMILKAITEANKNAREVLTAIKGRLNREQAEREKQEKELSAIANDTNRSQIVRKMAQNELEELKTFKTTITPAEKAAFSEELEAMLSGIKELRKQDTIMRGLFALSGEELSNLRKDTLGVANIELFERWADSAKADFDGLVK